MENTRKNRSLERSQAKECFNQYLKQTFELPEVQAKQWRSEIADRLRKSRENTPMDYVHWKRLLELKFITNEDFSKRVNDSPLTPKEMRLIYSRANKGIPKTIQTIYDYEMSKSEYKYKNTYKSLPVECIDLYSLILDVPVTKLLFANPSIEHPTENLDSALANIRSCIKEHDGVFFEAAKWSSILPLGSDNIRRTIKTWSEKLNSIKNCYYIARVIAILQTNSSSEEIVEFTLEDILFGEKTRRNDLFSQKK